MAEKVLAAVIRKAYVQGVSTRSVDELVKAMGMTGISKSQVSRLCMEIDDQIAAFLNRPLEGEGPIFGWMQPMCRSVPTVASCRSPSLLRSRSRSIAAAGERWAWQSAVRSRDLVATCCVPSLGLRGVKLVISDAHQGLRSCRGMRRDRTALRC
jgi:putative transposase